MGQGQDGGIGRKGTPADAWTHAPSRCTRTCCRAARLTPWPPSRCRSFGSCQSLSARPSVSDADYFRRLLHFRSQAAFGLIHSSALRSPAPLRCSAIPDCACADRTLAFIGRIHGSRVPPGPLVRALKGSPCAPFLPRLLPGPGPAGAVVSAALGSATAATLFVRPPARWKSHPGSPSAVRRRKRCGGRGKGGLRTLTPLSGL